MENIDFWNYDENDAADEEKWEVYSDGGVGPFLNVIADDKEFDDDRDNPVSMGGKGQVEVEYQDWNFFPL